MKDNVYPGRQNFESFTISNFNASCVLLNQAIDRLDRHRFGSYDFEANDLEDVADLARRLRTVSRKLSAISSRVRKRSVRKDHQQIINQNGVTK